MKYIASFSGGKDSAAMLLLILEKRLPLDEIVFIDNSTNTTTKRRIYKFT
ncbi:TPA: phosphoadenosine phosphosulfate reductase family protein [Clostridioides difficile]